MQTNGLKSKNYVQKRFFADAIGSRVEFTPAAMLKNVSAFPRQDRTLDPHPATTVHAHARVLSGCSAPGRHDCMKEKEKPSPGSSGEKES